MLRVYMKYSSTCEKTHAIFSKDVFFSMREFFRFAVASVAMVCLTITNLYYYIPYGFAATARCCFGLRCTLERKGSLDRNADRVYCTSISACS
ncbi:hypothetical protein SO802_024811 [Lithocarpus litseifolius]|uniref:Uncharacterized protein n=1 Tax=Lithocarpus litseifolius TaxID=425828 RepID=A0AAW2CAN5_9ROSI